MDTEQLLATARSNNVPSGWNVWPLHRDRVKRSVISWTAVGLFGVLLFVGAFAVTVPDNFTHGSFAVVVASLVLLLLATMRFGGLGLAMCDYQRLEPAGEFVHVITPNDYVHADHRKVTRKL